IVDKNRLEKLAGSGGNFGGNVWTPDPNASSSTGVVPNISGVWRADDQGIYAIKQMVDLVSWEGVSGDGGRGWTHTFNGLLRGDIIIGHFFDHPPGVNRGAGDLSIRIVNRTRLEKLVGSGGNFGGSVWSREPGAGWGRGGVAEAWGIRCRNDVGT